MARLHLPQPGQAGQHFETAEMLKRILRDFARNRRTWTHDRHFPAQHVKELRQLIKRVLAQEPSRARNPRVSRHLEEDPIALVVRHQLPLLLLRILDHGAELEARKHAPPFADPL